MTLDWMPEWCDNPILVKHLRSRLRRQPLALAIAVTLVLCLALAWGGYELDGFRTGGVFGALLALQTFVLGIMGATQVGVSVSDARASGILDFHRISPLSPAELVVGYLLGAPVREYLLFALTLPFSLLCVAAGTPDFRGFVQVLILLLFTSWVLHAFALINGLVFRRQSGGRGMVGLVVLLGMMTSWMWSGFGTIANVLDREPRLSFFSVSLPWLAVFLLYEIPVFYFLYLASRRKIESERIHAFSKVQGITAMAASAVLMLGGVWTQSEPELTVVVFYALTATAIVLTTMVTPNQSEYYKGLWRAHKLGQPRLSVWDDFATNRTFLGVVAGMVLVAATLAWNQVRVIPRSSLSPVIEAFPLAIANCVLVVLYHGLAYQYFPLRFGRRGLHYLALFLFLIWVVPLLSGVIYALDDSRRDQPAQAVFAISPLAGIGLTSGAFLAMSRRTDLAAIVGAALTPSLLFTFVFNALVVSARRRVQRAVQAAIERGRIESALSPPSQDGSITSRPAALG